MKKLLGFLPLCILLYACPFESTVPLAERPEEAVDTSLLGYWYGIVKDGSDFFGIEALEITRSSDSVYAITRYGKSIKGDFIMPDTAYFTGYTSYVSGQRYMNVEGTVLILTARRNKPSEYVKHRVFYLSTLDVRNDTLSVKTITEGFSPTRKGFRTAGELKQTVIELTDQKKDIFDDLYLLSYRRIPKPQPFKSF